MTDASRLDREIPSLPVMLAPTILAVGFVVTMYLGAGVHILAATRAMLVWGVAGLVLTIVLTMVMGDRVRGGVLALVIVLLLLVNLPIATLALGVIALALVVERLRASGRPPGSRWTVAGRVLDGVAVVLVLVLGVQALNSGAVGRIADDLSPPARYGDTSQAVARGSLPDIYILVLDGHIRPDRMRELFDADQADFVDGLRERGFAVADGSRSNYVVTGQSLPTMLNMMHLPDLLRERGIDMRAVHGGGAIRSMINSGAAIHAFREAGYRVVSLSPGFEHVSLRKADEFIDTGQLNEFEYTLLRVTTFAPLVEFIAPELLADQHRARIHQLFDSVVSVASREVDRPRLVWVHVPSPHAPAVFGPPGGPNPPTPDFDTFFDDTASGQGVDRETYGRRYVDQTAAVDVLALEAIDGILAAAVTPPVILLLSDHGSGAGLEWARLANSDLDERTAILFAALTPGHQDLFGPTPTLINTFGTLLRTYTSIAPDPLPDTIYVPLNDYGEVEEIDPSRIRWP